MKIKWNSFYLRGLTAALASLLIVALFATLTLMEYSDVINKMFDIKTSVIQKGENTDGDNEYYKSDYGEINAENFLKLQEDAYNQVINEAKEGAVLMKNHNNALPLSESERKLTLFGNASENVLWRTNAAGSKVFRNEKFRVDLYRALTEQGFQVNQTMREAYKSSTKTRSIGSGVGDTPYGQRLPLGQEEPASFYTQELKDSWADYDDVAIVVLSREGGEGIDMKTAETDVDGTTISSLALHKDERDLLSMIQDANFSKTVLLVNSPYQMELGWLDEYGIDACLWISTPGLTGYTGIVNLLTGTETPSGRLVNTWATNSLSSPAVKNAAGNTPQFANRREIVNSDIVTDSQFNTTYASVQQENIYVGYKYYETRYADCVMQNANANNTKGSSDGQAWNYAKEICFPFGFGLSYTSFSQRIVGDITTNADGNYVLSVEVANVGTERAGKCVVQVYAQTPYGVYEKQNQVEKSAVQLVAFDKTRELLPGETQTLEIEIEKYFLASYDENNAKGYILSEGNYYFAIGENSHDAVNQILSAQGFTDLTDENGNNANVDARNKVRSFQGNLDKDTYAYSKETGNRVTNQFDNCDINYWEGNNVTYLTRADWNTFPTQAASVVAKGEEMLTLLQGDFYKKPSNAPSVSNYTQGEDKGLTFVMMKDVDYENALWEDFLDQIPLEELVLITSNYFGSKASLSVGLPEQAAGDGCDSIVGDITYDKALDEDERQPCLYSSLLSATWNKQLIANRGKLLANEGLFLDLSEGWTGGGNLHRTPFGGRNGEYYSEDANLCYMIGAIELPEMDKRGVLGGMKHFAGNDQETRREGVCTFYTEQSFRENALRGFEGALRKGKCKATMQSFNRQGVVWSSASYALNVSVLREEWGFEGHVITDATFGDRRGWRSHYATTLTAGTDLYCLDNNSASSNIILQEITENDDGYLLGKLREAAKNNFYALSRTCTINGIDSSDKIVPITPTWVMLTYAIDALIAVAFIVVFVLFILQKIAHKALSTLTKTRKSALGWINFAATILSAVALILCLVYFASLETFNVPVLSFSILSILSSAALFVAENNSFVDNDFLAVVGSVLSAVSFGLFVSNSETLGSIADMIQGIIMFGHKEFVPIIIAIAVIMFISTLLRVISCYSKRKQT